MKSKRLLTYLASPYTPIEPGLTESQIIDGKQARFESVAWATAFLFGQHPKWNIFSPIVHSHPLHAVCEMGGDWKFWSRIDMQFIDLAERVVVYCIEGWRQSTGVTAKIKYARKTGVPVLYLNPTTYSLSKHEPKS
jgi:hypothetical protein